MPEGLEEKLEKYLGLTREALEKTALAVPEKSHLRKVAEDFLDLAKRYVSDAEYYREKDPLTALASVSYAHAWLDAGARLGLFDVGFDDRLFTLAE